MTATGNRPLVATALAFTVVVLGIGIWLLLGRESGEPQPVIGADPDQPADGGEAAGADEPAGDDEIDLEAAQQRALEAAATEPAVDFEPVRATDAVPNRPFIGDGEAFGDHQFVYVWSEMGHTENHAFAVAPDGSVYTLPGDFDDLAREAGLDLGDEADARSLLEFYLDFHSRLPGTDELVVIDAIRDVPGVADADAERHDTAVQPARVEPDDAGWRFDLHTWQAVGGDLTHWLGHVGSAGELDIRTSETIDTGLGDHLTIE